MANMHYPATCKSAMHTSPASRMHTSSSSSTAAEVHLTKSLEELVADTRSKPLRANTASHLVGDLFHPWPKRGFGHAASCQRGMSGRYAAWHEIAVQVDSRVKTTIPAQSYHWMIAMGALFKEALKMELVNIQETLDCHASILHTDFGSKPKHLMTQCTE
eukprot:3937689-Amphidinium_carterae.1